MRPAESTAREATSAMAASALVTGALSGSQPVSRAHLRCSGRRAVVIDKTRLQHGVAGASMIAAGQHVVIAQDVLATIGVLNQCAQSTAAAIDDGTCACIEVAAVSAGAAEEHGAGECG